MIDRRQLLTVGGLLGALAPGGTSEAAGVAPAYGVGQMSDRTAADIASTLGNISKGINEIVSQQSFAAIVPLRNRQIDYLKANSKFPDFIDVSADIWMAVYDWHVRLQQQLILGRDSTGRYTLMLGYTALVLRPDVVPNFISAPYDNR
jgi:hypothetical protein